MCFSDGLLISFCDCLLIFLWLLLWLPVNIFVLLSVLTRNRAFECCLLIFLWLLLWLPVNIFVLLSVLTRNRAFECSYQKSGFRAFVTAWAFVLLWLPVDWSIVSDCLLIELLWLPGILFFCDCLSFCDGPLMSVCAFVTACWLSNCFWCPFLTAWAFVIACCLRDRIRCGG
jgi:hypothetical protein